MRGGQKSTLINLISERTRTQCWKRDLRTWALKPRHLLNSPSHQGARDQEVVQFCTMHVIVTTLWGAEKILQKGRGMKSRQQGMQEASRASQLIAETQFPPL